jgi:hypothetical protein
MGRPRRGEGGGAGRTACRRERAPDRVARQTHGLSERSLSAEGLVRGCTRAVATVLVMWDILTWHNGTLAIAWWFFIVLVVVLLAAGGSAAARR